MNSKTIKMKKFYFLFLIFVVQISFAQDFFYKKDASSIPIVGEESLVIFEKPPVNKYEELNAEKSIGPSFLRFFDTNLNTFVNLSYKIIKNQIDRDVLKYTDSFSAKRTYLFDQRIPAFKVKREIVTKNQKERLTAFSAQFIPEIIKGNALVYQLHHIECNASGAKVWEKTNFNNYEIKINIAYQSGGKKEIFAFQNVKVPLVEIGNAEQFNVLDENNDYKYITDLFVIPDDFVLLEVFVSIQETSASKVKADKVQRLKNEYSDDSKKIVDKLIKYLRDNKKLQKEGSPD